MRGDIEPPSKWIVGIVLAPKGGFITGGVIIKGWRLLLGGGLRLLSTSGGPSGTKPQQKLHVPRSDAPKEPTL